MPPGGFELYETLRYLAPGFIVFYTAVRFIAPGFWEAATPAERVIYATLLGFAMRSLGLYSWPEAVRALKDARDESLARILATHDVPRMHSRLVWDLGITCASERERAHIRNYLGLGSLKIEMTVILWILLIVVPSFALVAELVTWQFVVCYVVAMVILSVWGRSVFGDGMKDLGRSYDLGLHVVRRELEKDRCLGEQIGLLKKNTES